MTFRLMGPQDQYLDGNGDPLAGGKVFAYINGTSTPKDTYTDSAKTATNANPVILDGDGRAPIYLDGDYKIVVKDSNDVTIFTQDNVGTPPTTADVQAAVAAAQTAPSYADLSDAAAATIDATIKRVYVTSYSTGLDGGGAYYKRVDAQPSHELRFRSTDRFLSDETTDASNGGWWEIDEPVVASASSGYDNSDSGAAGNATSVGYLENYRSDKSGIIVAIPPGSAHFANFATLAQAAGAMILSGSDPTVPTQSALNGSNRIASTEYADDVTQGQHTVYVSAVSMTPTVTAGAATYTGELATNDVMKAGMVFDASAEEHAQFAFQAPKSWDLGTIVAEFIWTDGDTAGAGNVVWGIEGLACGDSDPMDAAFGTAQEVTDTFLTSGDAHRSAESSAMTLAGTPAAEDLLIFQVYRKAADAADTYTQDAVLLGVRLHITTNAPTDD